MRTVTSHEGWVDLLKEGYEWQCWLAARFRVRELEAEVDELWISPDSRLNHLYTDKIDIRVYSRSGLCRRIACKARRTYFTGPSDYPHPKIIVDDVKSCDKKPTPHATVVISQYTCGILAIPEATRPSWKKHIFPTPHGPKNCYYCSSADCRTFDQLCDWLART